MSTRPMSAVGTMVRTVKKRRNGLRLPVRSLMAPRIGETMALTRTEANTAQPNQRWPSVSPRKLVAHRLMAKLTIAKLKIVFAKS